MRHTLRQVGQFWRCQRQEHLLTAAKTIRNTLSLRGIPPDILSDLVARILMNHLQIRIDQRQIVTSARQLEVGMVVSQLIQIGPILRMILGLNSRGPDNQMPLGFNQDPWKRPQSQVVRIISQIPSVQALEFW